MLKCYYCGIDLYCPPCIIRKANPCWDGLYCANCVKRQYECGVYLTKEKFEAAKEAAKSPGTVLRPHDPFIGDDEPEEK